jgi:exosortase
MTPSTSESGVAAASVVSVLRSSLTESAAHYALLVTLAALLPFLVFWPTIVSLATIWSDPLRVELSHGYLTLLIVVWLIWFRRHDLAQAPLMANRFAMVGLAVLSVAWLVLVRSSVQIGHQMLLPIIAATTVCAVCGWTMTRRALFPLAYLYLAMPFWTVFNAPLQWGSVIAVRGMLRILGIPAYFSGTSIEVSAGVFEIADGCSGLRLMVVGLAIAVLYGELQRASLGMRVVLIAAAALLSAFANWLRILIIIGAGHFYGIDHPLVADHIWFGWVVFAVVMVVFFWFANRLPIDATREPEAGVGTAIPWRNRIRLLIVAAALLAIAPLWSSAQYALDRFQSQPEFVAPSLPGWTIDANSASWRPKFAGADRETRVDYVSQTHRVELYAANYGEQRQGKELTGYGNSTSGDEAPRVLVTQMDASIGVPRVHQVITNWDRQKWLYWYSYRVGDQWHLKPLYAQLHYGMTSLWRIPASQVLVVRTRCDDELCTTAAEQLLPIWNAATKSLESVRTNSEDAS